MEIGCGQQTIKQTPHSRPSQRIPHSPHIPIPAKAGISRLTGAGRATPAPHRFVICADGAGIGRFPLSREWGVRLILLSTPFSIPAFTHSPHPHSLPHLHSPPTSPFPPHPHSSHIPIPPTSSFPHIFISPPTSLFPPISPFPRKRESPD